MLVDIIANARSIGMRETFDSRESAARTFACANPSWLRHRCKRLAKGVTKMPAQVSVARARRTARVAVTRRRTEIQEAVDRIYRRYGDDLSAFYRDVKKSILVEESKGKGKRTSK